ncbi:MAG: sulfotransferase [Planctomycetota bacterium]
MSPRVIAFVVGTSRGGTTWLSKVLNCHPRIACFGESGFFGRHWFEPDADGRLSGTQVREKFDGAIAGTWGPHTGDVGTLRRANTPELHAALRERLEPMTAAGGTVAEVFDAYAGAFGVAEGKPLVIEKTPHHVNHVDRILDAVPDAKFIVTLRDPYSFMRSYKFQGQQYDAERRAHAERVYHPITCALIWRRYFRSVFELETTHADRVFRFDIGALADREEAVLDDLQDFLSVERAPLAGQVPRDNSSFPSGQREELGAGDVWWMNRIAGPEIDAGGWPRRSAGGMVGLLPALTLPIWAVRNFGHLRRTVRNPARYAASLFRR